MISPRLQLPGGPTKKHLGYLDSLPVLAAVYVVMNYACSIYKPGEGLTGPTRLLYLLFLHGHSTVKLFIVLSGFCLMLPVVRGDGRLRDRAWRLKLGALASGISFSSDSRLVRLRQRVLWMVVSFILFSLVVVTKSRTVSTPYADFVVGLWATTVLVAAAHTEPNWLQRALSWKPLVFVGTFAYSIYLIHAPLLQVIWQYGLYPMHLSPLATLLALCSVGTLLILGVSYGFFLAFERPFLNTRPRETMQQTAEEAALSPAP